ASYGVPDALEAAPRATHAAFAAALPQTHLDFLTGCGLWMRVGSYVFVHAGIRPGVAMEAQEREDLIWIREPFLSSTEDYGFKVVHGHTIVPRVEHHPNRIAIDTGAVRTEVLSCLVLEGRDVALLGPDGVQPLPLGAGLGLRGGLMGLFGRRWSIRCRTSGRRLRPVRARCSPFHPGAGLVRRCRCVHREAL